MLHKIMRPSSKTAQVYSKKLLLLPAGLLVAGGILTSAVHAMPAPTGAETDLKNVIDKIIADPRLEGAQTDVLVRSAKDGSVLYSHNPDNRLIPASNNKLYSSLSALQILGPEYTFTTTVASDGVQHGPVLRGNLYLKGTGDPTVQVADYEALAAAVKAAGITKITGKLVTDDTFFDRRQLGSNWTWDNAPYYYQPEISALTVAVDANLNIGSLTVETKPAAHVGKPIEVKTVPATDYVKIQNSAVTGPAGSANTLSIERQLGVNTIIVSGSVPIDGDTESNLSTVSDTTGYVGAIFRDALRRQGIRVHGDPERGVTPADSRVIKERQSPPLSQLATPLLKLSNNGIAEILVKTMGKKTQNQGSWSAGLGAEAGVLSDDFNVVTGKIALDDGSGLSNLNFTTPRQTTNLLIAAQNKPWFQSWYDSLPIAGKSDPLVGGTLRSRMVGTKAEGNVHGKTGSLIGVSALSGYVTSADGERLVFSIMENNFISASPKPLEDAVAVALANFSRQGGVNAAAMAAFNNEMKARLTMQKDDGLECSWTKQGC